MLRGWRLLVAGAIASLLLLLQARSVAADEPQSTVHNVRFTLVVENPTGKAMPGRKVWLYGPIERLATQTLLRLDIDTEHVVQRDALGNTIIELGPLDLAPYESRIVTLAAEVAMTAWPRSQRDRPDALFLQPQPFVEADDPGIVSLAATLRGDDARASARAIYDWVASHLNYAGYVADELGARYALQNRRGDCTEYADLSAALARSLGIPARVLGGYVVNANAVLRGRDYHNWTELWLNDRWVLLDAQKGHFAEQADQYIAFHVLAPGESFPMQGAERFRADDGLVVRWD